MKFLFGKNKIYSLSIILAAVFILSTVSVAFAAFFIINTNDGSIDPNWTPLPFRDDPTGETIPNYDIDQVWFGTNASSPSEFYFRMDLVSTIPLDGSSIEARLDCDGNGNFNDPMDVTVAYYPDFDMVEAFQANVGFPSDLYDPSYGEVLSGGNYEW